MVDHERKTPIATVVAWVSRHKALSAIAAVGFVVIVVGQFTESVDSIWSFSERIREAMNGESTEPEAQAEQPGLEARVGEQMTPRAVGDMKEDSAASEATSADEQDGALPQPPSQLRILEIQEEHPADSMPQIRLIIGRPDLTESGNFTFRCSFKRPFAEALYNYYWDLPSRQGVKFFHPKRFAEKSQTLEFTGEALPAGYYLHIIVRGTTLPEIVSSEFPP